MISHPRQAVAQWHQLKAWEAAAKDALWIPVYQVNVYWPHSHYFMHNGYNQVSPRGKSSGMTTGKGSEPESCTKLWESGVGAQCATSAYSTIRSIVTPQPPALAFPSDSLCRKNKRKKARERDQSRPALSSWKWPQHWFFWVHGVGMTLAWWEERGLLLPYKTSYEFFQPKAHWDGTLLRHEKASPHWWLPKPMRGNGKEMTCLVSLRLFLYNSIKLVRVIRII